MVAARERQREDDGPAHAGGRVKPLARSKPLDEEWRRNTYFIHIHSAIRGANLVKLLIRERAAAATCAPLSLVCVECRAAWNPSHGY